MDVIYEYGVDQALLILNDAIYQLNLGTIDLLAYFTKPNYAATVGPLNTFLDSLAAEYLRMVEVSEPYCSKCILRPCFPT